MLRLEMLFGSEESCAGESAPRIVIRDAQIAQAEVKLLPRVVTHNSRIANLAKFAIRVGAHNDFARVKSVSNRGISLLEMGDQA